MQAASQTVERNCYTRAARVACINGGSGTRTKYTYDTAGNTLTYLTNTATYNNRGRMATLKKGSSTATYVYNALGQRVKQSGGAPGTVLYTFSSVQGLFRLPRPSYRESYCLVL